MTNKEIAAAAGPSMPEYEVDGELAALVTFRARMAGSFRRWTDTLIETVDAMTCSGGPIASPAWLSLEPELRRGYGSVYQALETEGVVDADALRDALVTAAASRGQPSWWAVDVTPWQRPEAHMSPARSMVYTCGDDQVATPGWPALVAAHVGDERSAQVLGVDAELLSGSQNTNEAAAAQIRRVIDSLARTGSRAGGEVPLFLLDSGFCPIYLTQQVSDVAQILVRLRTDRVFYGRAEPKPAHQPGPHPRHGARFKLSDPSTHHEPDQALQVRLNADTDAEVTVTANIWHQLHPAPRQRRKWDGIEVVEGTIIHRTAVWTATGHTQHWWLWWAGPADSFDANTVTRAYLHRFSIEHGFKFAKHLGWTNYKPITVAAATNWTWLILAAMGHFILARDLAEGYRLPWDQPGPPTPARVHRAFRRTWARLPRLARAPKHSQPGPGRPPGAPNRNQRTKQNITRKGRAPNTGHPKGRQHRLAPEHETARP